MTPQKLGKRLMKQHPGLVLTLAPTESCVVLKAICLPSEGQQRGVGTAVMETVVRTADEQGWLLALSPTTAWGASSSERLERFYNRFGFVRNEGVVSDGSVAEAMIRPVHAFA